MDALFLSSLTAIFVGVVCIFVAIFLLYQATKRVIAEQSPLTWSLVVMCVLWLIIFVCGTLRIAGILPQVDEPVTNATVLAFMKDDMATIAIICGCIAIIVLDLVLWLMIRTINERNKIWWILGFLFLTSVGLLTGSFLVYWAGFADINGAFYTFRFLSMIVPGWSLGLSYKGINMIFNFSIVEMLVYVLSATWLLWILCKRVKAQRSTLNIFVRVLGFIGVVAYLIIYVIYLNDLYKAPVLATGENYLAAHYDVPNYIIFLFGFILPITMNCTLAHFLTPKKNNYIENL